MPNDRRSHLLIWEKVQNELGPTSFSDISRIRESHDVALLFCFCNRLNASVILFAIGNSYMRLARYLLHIKFFDSISVFAYTSPEEMRTTMPCKISFLKKRLSRSPTVSIKTAESESIALCFISLLMILPCPAKINDKNEAFILSLPPCNYFRIFILF